MNACSLEVSLDGDGVGCCDDFILLGRLSEVLGIFVGASWAATLVL